MENNINNNCLRQCNGFAPRRKYVNPNPSTVAVPMIHMNQTTNDQTHLMTNINSDYTNYNIAKHNNDANNNHNIQQPPDQQEIVLRPTTNTNNRKSSKSSTKLSLEDSLKMTIGGFAMKTPVSLLQEILSRRGVTPNYELLQVEGAIHEPTFRYRVSFNDKGVPFTAVGAGRSKKEAKHSAAKSLIDKLTGIEMADSQTNICSSNISFSDSPIDGNINTSGIGDGDKIFGNPIGWLQEMCMSRHWPPPTYETETEVGLPHERLYTIACTILNFREIGQGKSKKIAKRTAAHKMWTRLQESPLSNEQIIETIHSELNSDKTYYSDMKGCHMPAITSQHSVQTSECPKTLTYLTGKMLSKLQQTCLADNSIDYIEFLNDLAHENEFEVTYINIEEKSFTQYQCLVQISSPSIGVCLGCGQTSLEAKKKAAQNALQYLIKLPFR